MIKRTYFMSIEKYANDGTGSYTSSHSTFTFSSWFLDPNEAFNACYERLKTQAEHFKGGDPVVKAFNRI